MSEMAAPARKPASTTASISSRCAGSPVTTNESPFLTPSEALTIASAYRVNWPGSRMPSPITARTLLVQAFRRPATKRRDERVVPRRVDLRAAGALRTVHLGERPRDELQDRLRRPRCDAV